VLTPMQKLQQLFLEYH